MGTRLTTYANWTNERQIRTLGTNAGAGVLAFQHWHHFKEAFTPEFVARAIQSLNGRAENCLDPFGGSGTTALACQFLGVKPITFEVNPYLADVIEAKLCHYDLSTLAKDVGAVVERGANTSVNIDKYLEGAPRTMVEPGVKGKWVFNREVAETILALRQCIDELPNKKNRRLMRVILGGRLVEVSNVRISGKGRRYRSGWENRDISQQHLMNKFIESLRRVVGDIANHQDRPILTYDIKRGDARKLINNINNIDLCVFSSPYPNSFVRWSELVLENRTGC